MRKGPLTGAWGTAYDESWRPAFDAFFEEQRSVPIRVLSFGPRPGTRHYSKREELGEHMGRLPATSVLTPERIAEEDERFSGLDQWAAEEVQAEVAADLVVVLLVDDPSASGAPAEVTRLGTNPEIREKFRVLAPRRARGDMPLLLKDAYELPEAQRFLYSPTQFAECLDMRQMCEEWIEAKRRGKHLEERRQRSR